MRLRAILKLAGVATLGFSLLVWIFSGRPDPGSLDQLDPRRIPVKHRFAGQPPELVAVLDTLEGHLGCVGVAFSPDGKLLAAGFGSGAVAVWEAGRLTPAFVLEAHRLPVSTIAFTPDGKTMIDASYDHTIRVWNLSRKTPAGRATLRGHTDHVWSLAVSADGRILASAGSGDKTVRLWDLAGEPPRETAVIELPEDLVFSASLSPDARTLACTCKDAIHLWDLAGDKPREKGVLRGQEDSVWRVAFAPAGGSLASCGKDRTVRLWDLKDGDPRQRAKLEGHAGSGLYGLAFSPDGETLASADEAGRVIVWDAGKGSKLHRWDLPGGPRQVAFAADGKHLAVSTNRSVVYVLRMP
jgi:WD40 repeat protein